MTMTGAMASASSASSDVDDEQHHRDQHDQQHLAEQVQRQRDDRGEVLGVGGDAADDLARRVLVVERHVARQHGVEGVRAQL